MTKRKNILIFYTDQQRFDSLGCNGNEHAITPNIDNLAKDGINFTRHITASTVCMPSRASFFTGLHIPAHGVSSNGIPLWRREDGDFEDKSKSISLNLFGLEVKNRIPTIADMFAEQNYHTALFGKLHLQPHLADAKYGFYESYATWEDEETINIEEPFYGFQTRKIILGHGEQSCQFDKGHYGRWFNKNHPELLDKILNPKNADPKSEREDIYPSEVSAEIHPSTWLANETCNYLEQQKENEEPFFIFVGFPDPHHPFTPPKELAEKFKNVPLPDFNKIDDIKSPKPKVHYATFEQMHTNENDIANAYRNTMASVHLIDTSIGKVVDTLKNLDVYDDTIILFTADHGEFLGDWEMLCKYDVAFNNLLNVPFVLKPAKDFPIKEKIVNTPMSNVDVASTLLAMNDLTNDHYLQGIDIFSDTAHNNHPMATCFSIKESNRCVAIYDDTYRYTYHLNSHEEELYNHTEDFKEQHNLATDPNIDVKDICEKFKREVLQRHVECDLGIFNHYATW